MKTIIKLIVPVGILATLAGCVVAPAGYYHRGYYYGPRVAVVAPAPSWSSAASHQRKYRQPAMRQLHFAKYLGRLADRD